MNLLKCILTANDCYTTGWAIKPKGVMVHSTGCNNATLRRYVQPLKGSADYAALTAQLGVNSNGNDWNRAGTGACVHGFIGKLADGSVAAAQTLPWNWRGWHAGNGTSGRSANDTHISFEICEDGLSDAAYFAKVYRAAVELTAMLCKEYGLNPLADGVVICHQEGYRRGVASNHADVLHWFPKYGKSMDNFRADVAAEMGQKPAAPAAVLESASGYDASKAGTYTVTPADGLNIRAGAGTDKPVLGTLPQGAQAACYGYYSAVGGADWLLVVSGGITGYVSAAYLKAEAVPAVDGSNDSNTKEDDEMLTYEQWKEYMDQYRKELSDLPASGWAGDELAAAKAAGITDGQRPRDFVTREEAAVMAMRSGQPD